MEIAIVKRYLMKPLDVEIFLNISTIINYNIFNNYTSATINDSSRRCYVTKQNSDMT